MRAALQTPRLPEGVASGVGRCGRVFLLLGVLFSVGQTVEARANCEAGRTAPSADPSHPSAELASGVWQRVYQVFYALTGRVTELKVLAESARLPDGKPFAASAFLCPATASTSPTVYLTWPLIMRAQTDALYDVDFIALVLGHELGHRVRDLTFEGARDTQQGGPEIEGRADLHGAFFASLAGYSSRRLACDAALDTFLDVEAHVGESARETRRQKLAEALRAFDVYESLYQASTHFLFGDLKLAKRITSWVDKHLTRRLEPIPEFKVLHALALLTEAAPDSPAAEIMALPGYPSNHLRCGVVFPQNTAFFDDLVEQAFGPTKATTRDGTADIRTAMGLLRDAERLGASPLVVASGLACAEAWLGDPQRATTELQRARKFANEARPNAGTVGSKPALMAALDANQAFIDWLVWIRANPAPLGQADNLVKDWAKRASSQAKSLEAHRALSTWVAGLSGWPRPTPPKVVAPLSCPRVAEPGPGWSRMPNVPARPKELVAGCPCGWLELHLLDDDLSRSDPYDGVRTCVPAGWATGLRWVDLKLPLGSVDKVGLLVEGGDALSGPLGSLERWQSQCKSLTLEGTSDKGLSAWRGECPTLHADQVVLMSDGCRVVSAMLTRQP